MEKHFDNGENIAVSAHRNIVMGRRVRQIAKNISAIIPEDVVSILDVGAGTGEIAQSIHTLQTNFSGIFCAFSKCHIFQGELSEIA